MLVGLSAVGSITTYTPDPSTLHLWHFDETALPCVDAATAGTGTNLTYMIGGASLGNAAYASGSVSFTRCINFGTLTTSNAVILPLGSSYVGTPIPFTYAGADGAFTFEALVQVKFNPANNYSVTPNRGQPFQIMDCDADGSGGSGTRVFQFRIDPVGMVSGGRDTSVCGIEFINGATVVAVAPIPTSGPDAIVSNAWYHVAVTFNGRANTTSNLLFYWTLVDPSRTNADCIYGTNMTSLLPGTSNAATIFSVGNSARNPSGGSGPDLANFLGNIDEVRISGVARAANAMLFANANAAIVSQPAPASQWVAAGQPFNLSVSASGQAPLNYQWWFNGSPLAGATNSLFTNAAAQLTDAGNYAVVVANSFNSVTSAVATVAVTNLAILSSPASVVAGYAGTATFSVTALGAALQYQWWHNGRPVAGATNGTLTLTPLTAADAGTYCVVVANSSGSRTSASATLTLTGPVMTLNQINNGDVAASGYAYAGSSSINAVSFICSGLMTVGNQQFLAYYGRHQTNAAYAYNNTIWVARRTVGSNDWQVFRTTFTADDITDGHDVVNFGLDGAGYMHLSWGMHNGNLHYARSTTAVTGTGSIAFTADLGANAMTGNEVAVTYPQFISQPNGDLLFLYRVGGPGGGSGGGDTWLNRWSVASRTWTNVNVSGGAGFAFIKGYWSSTDNYNAYPYMPCADAAGNVYLMWCWRETPAYESNHDLEFVKSPDGGVTWRRLDNTAYSLPLSKSGESGDPNSIAQVVISIPQNYSLINQAGMCVDASNNPVAATWWAPGTGANNYRRQYMVVFPDANGVWQTRQVSNRTNDPVGTMELDSVVRDLGRPVVVCDRQNRLIVLYRDNTANNGLKVAYTPPYALDPQRTNWTTVTLTTDNLGNYEPVIDLARWQRDNVLDILYQASNGEGYTAPVNTASLIGVLEWDAATYFNHHPALQVAPANAGSNVMLTWNSQPGWGYQVQWSTNLTDWYTLATLNGISDFSSQYHCTNSTGTYLFWRLATQPGGF